MLQKLFANASQKFAFNIFRDPKINLATSHGVSTQSVSSLVIKYYFHSYTMKLGLMKQFVKAVNRNVLASELTEVFQIEC